MRYSNSSIWIRVFQNLRTYGLRMTLLKSMRKLCNRSGDKQSERADYSQKQIPVLDNVEKFIRDAVQEDNKELAREAFDWFESWRSWKDSQLLDAPESWNAGSGLSIALYMLIRIVEPSLVIETGTANGASAASISAALEANKRGVLHTFDVHEFELSLVPVHLRPRIIKHQIKRRGGLAAWMRENHELIDSTSIFIHDSNHSYEHQKWEYSLAKNFGFKWLVSDDVDDSHAFIEILDGKKSVLIDGDKLVGVCIFNN